jgi:hypothetical protein
VSDNSPVGQVRRAMHPGGVSQQKIFQYEVAFATRERSARNVTCATLFDLGVLFLQHFIDALPLRPV